MKARRQFIRKLGGVAAFSALTMHSKAGTFLNKEEKTKEIEGDFLHMVFFWLVNETEETHNRFYHELTSFVDGVEVIKTEHIGTPADTDREVIDNTWSYSLVLSFESKREHDIYQEHPLHKKFIANASHLWKKVLVYDSVKT